ncbi:HMGL-like family protein [Mycobacterium xenopi 4042]|uniref:HMGL-like family protein n=1 Tax=Mycobacterium xenopi 4042 TaxID=1299334 RepID=X7Z4V7_MYCXE|nr:HMGL-like family protein [Mycobacterium xenopi 4042]
MAASDAFSHANVGRSSAEATTLISDIVTIAHDAGATAEVIIATAWDCPFDGPTPPRRVLDIAAAACEGGVDRLSIADTIGTTTPGRVVSLIAALRPLIGTTALGAHFHNTRGAGLASAYAAVTAGVSGWTPRSAAWRLPVRARRHRQYCHRRSGLPAHRQRHRCRRRPGRGHWRCERCQIGCRPRPSRRAAARRDRKRT